MWPTSDGGRLERLVVFVLVQGAPTPVGELVFEGREYGQSFFRSARSWLDNREARFALAPVLSSRPRATNSAPHPVPLFFSDAAPDGWGKAVLRFAYPAQTWGMGEFLAAAGDDRTGELLFGPDPSGPERFVPGRARAISSAVCCSIASFTIPTTICAIMPSCGAAESGGCLRFSTWCPRVRGDWFWRRRQVCRRSRIRLALSPRMRSSAWIGVRPRKFTRKSSMV